MTKAFKSFRNFYLQGLAAVLAVFLAAYFAFGGLFRAYAPRITAELARAEAAALEAAAGGEEMIPVEDAAAVAGVSEMYATSGGGYVIKVRAQGLEGPVALVVGLSGDGTVSGISVESHSETPDVGGLALREDYLSQYIGLAAAEGVDAYSGATYTSAAVRECVEKALLQRQVILGLAYDGPVELTEEELLAQTLESCLGEGYAKAETELAALVGKTESQTVRVTEVYTSEAGCGIVVEGEGHNGLIRIVVFTDPEGVVKKIFPIVQNESLDHGAKVFSEAALKDYEGYASFAYFDDGSGAMVFDGFSGATQTSMKLFQMVVTASDQIRLMNPAE